MRSDRRARRGGRARGNRGRWEAPRSDSASDKIEAKRMGQPKGPTAADHKIEGVAIKGKRKKKRAGEEIGRRGEGEEEIWPENFLFFTSS